MILDQEEINSSCFRKIKHCIRKLLGRSGDIPTEHAMVHAAMGHRSDSRLGSWQGLGAVVGRRSRGGGGGAAGQGSYDGGMM